MEKFVGLHLTHPKLVRNSGQLQCSARGPTPVLMPVPWSRGNDRSIECMSFDVGGNRSTWKKPTQTRGEHANSTQKGRDSNPGPSCCEATSLTTVLPYVVFNENKIAISILRMQVHCGTGVKTWKGYNFTHRS